MLLLPPGITNAVTATVRVPMNIAFVKYWGKADERRMLPLNDSVSANLDDLYAESTIILTTDAEADGVIVNEVPMPVGEGTRFAKVFAEFRRMIAGTDHAQAKILVVSTTSFPVKAGLASSAAGFAAIAYGLGKVGELNDAQVARLARLGSGSACRSLYPGFVHWDSSKTGDEDTFVVPVESGIEFASTLFAAVFVIDNKQKTVGSSEGMKRSVQTSNFLKYRVQEVVPHHVNLIKEAVSTADFITFADVTMRESNSLHAVCLDSLPPLSYLNETSFAMINAVHDFNSTPAGVTAAYTFDAGPNAVVLAQLTNAQRLISHFSRLPWAKFVFETKDEQLKEVLNVQEENNHGDLPEIRVILTKVGKGPAVVP
uniref:Diphosphomevalonate decarboxylase n=1 Tax=Panagrellus redivivus TaxID=6233 RepID=A0A7E4VMY4_PANRE